MPCVQLVPPRKQKPSPQSKTQPTVSIPGLATCNALMFLWFDARFRLVSRDTTSKRFDFLQESFGSVLKLRNPTNVLFRWFALKPAKKKRYHAKKHPDLCWTLAWVRSALWREVRLNEILCVFFSFPLLRRLRRFSMVAFTMEDLCNHIIYVCGFKKGWLLFPTCETKAPCLLLQQAVL